MRCANLRKRQLVASTCLACRKLKIKVGLRCPCHLALIGHGQLGSIILADVNGQSVLVIGRRAHAATAKGKTAYTMSRVERLGNKIYAPGFVRKMKGLRDWRAWSIHYSVNQKPKLYLTQLRTGGPLQGLEHVWYKYSNGWVHNYRLAADAILKHH